MFKFLAASMSLHWQLVELLPFWSFFKKKQRKDIVSVCGLYFFASISNKQYCYIANAKTKRDWLIRGHVALDKCNVSPRETSKKLLPGYEYKKNKMAA